MDLQVFWIGSSGQLERPQLFIRIGSVCRPNFELGRIASSARKNETKKISMEGGGSKNSPDFLSRSKPRKKRGYACSPAFFCKIIVYLGIRAGKVPSGGLNIFSWR